MLRLKGNLPAGSLGTWRPRKGFRMTPRTICIYIFFHFVLRLILQGVTYCSLVLSSVSVLYIATFRPVNESRDIPLLLSSSKPSHHEMNRVWWKDHCSLNIRPRHVQWFEQRFYNLVKTYHCHIVMNSWMTISYEVLFSLYFWANF